MHDDLITPEHIAGTAANLRAAAQQIKRTADRLDALRPTLDRAGADPEAARRVRMELLQARADAAALAEQFLALSREGAP